MTFCDDLIQAEEVNLLTRKIERVKGDLAFSAEEIVAKMARTKPEMLVDPAPSGGGSVLVQYNLGGLVQYHYGEANRARKICQHAIQLCETLAEQTGNRGWLNNAMQPYVNLGRLDAAKGDLEKSLKVFESVYRYVTGQSTLTIGEAVLGARDREDVLRAEPGIDRVMTNVYVKDSIRAYQFAREFQGLLGFTEKLRADPAFEQPTTLHSILEGNARALIALGQYNAALTVLADLKQQVTRERAPNISVLTLIADVYRRAGRPDRAKQVLDTVEQYLAKLEEAKVSPIFLGQLAYVLALGQYAIEDYDRAYENGKYALELATQVNDETWVVRTLVLLLKLAPLRTPEPNGRMGPSFWYEQLKWAAAGTLYRLERAMACRALAEAARQLGDEVAAPGDRVIFLRHAKELLRTLELTGCAEQAAAIGRELEAEAADSEEGAAFFDEESQYNLSVEDAYRALADFNVDRVREGSHAAHAA